MIGKIINTTVENNWFSFVVAVDGEFIKRSIKLDERGYKILLADLTTLFGKEKAKKLIQEEPEIIAEECRGIRVEFTTVGIPGKIKIDHFLEVV